VSLYTLAEIERRLYLDGQDLMAKTLADVIDRIDRLERDTTPPDVAEMKQRLAAAERANVALSNKLAHVKRTLNELLASI
jgi:hypothetical protein